MGLAFYVSSLASSTADAERGKQLWHGDPALRNTIPNLQALTQLTQAELAQGVGDDKARDLVAYLRRHPDALTSGSAQSLGLARKLAESLSAYEAGDHKKATALALSACLDGFEPLEPSLKALDDALMVRIESAMVDLRSAITKGESVETLRKQTTRLDALFDRAERVLAPEAADSGAMFAAAFTILLREGLEALLIVVAMIAFLDKASRRDVVAYVHGGWVAALAAGGLTWVAATYLLSVSGANRELTEGFGSLLAAAVLGVGWIVDAWQGAGRYLAEICPREAQLVRRLRGHSEEKGGLRAARCAENSATLVRLERPTNVGLGGCGSLQPTAMHRVHLAMRSRAVGEWCRGRGEAPPLAPVLQVEQATRAARRRGGSRSARSPPASLKFSVVASGRTVLVLEQDSATASRYGTDVGRRRPRCL